MVYQPGGREKDVAPKLHATPSNSLTRVALLSSCAVEQFRQVRSATKSPCCNLELLSAISLSTFLHTLVLLVVVVAADSVALGVGDGTVASLLGARHVAPQSVGIRVGYSTIGGLLVLYRRDAARQTTRHGVATW